ncbi:type-B carboxylesterase lipase family [Rhizoctonia solani]|uniref:Type-B carboxylesterase lipase family n=1 Tax=Rhizoctonia solani TaxID=456999 RepID=A0A8H7I5X9_9AGAM|nr:type-B carboxylesterase lipase family [Rhizoctonia solani]
MTAAGREFPLAKGSPAVESTPRDPPASYSIGFLLGAIALGTASYVAKSHFSSIADSLICIIPRLLNDTVPDVVSWLGVPYGLPPRRFRAAQPLDETPQKHNITDLFEYPQPCVQGWAPEAGLDDRGGAGSEDCLKINIHAPKSANIYSAPHNPNINVRFTSSYGNPRNWPFDNWVQRSSTPFVAVSIYYRLSVLGFLAAPNPRIKEYTQETTRNFFLMLEFMISGWRYVSYNGIFAPLVVIPKELPLWAKVQELVALDFTFSQREPGRKAFPSGNFTELVSPPIIQAARSQGAKLLITEYKKAGDMLLGDVEFRYKIRGVFSLDLEHPSYSQCLRDVDHVKLSQAADEGMFKYRKYTDWMWQPLLDNRLFNDFPHRLLDQAPRDIDVIVGHTTHDSVIALPPFEHWARATYPKLSSNDIRILENLYLQSGFSPENLTDAGLSEGLFKCGTYLMGNIYGSRVYTYRFDEPGPANPERADHCADNYILFEGTRVTLQNRFQWDNNIHPLTPPQRALSDELISHFITFAASGSPNVPTSSNGPTSGFASKLNLNNAVGEPKVWPDYTSGKRLVFRAEGSGTGTNKGTEGGSYIEELNGAEIQRCKTWETLASTIQV